MTGDDVLRRLAPHLSPDEIDLLRRRLGGEPGTDEVAWLDRLVDAASTLPLVDVPPVLAQALRRQMRGPVEVVEHTAVLRSDSRSAGELAGVRGVEPAEGWTCSYSCVVADLLVDVWPRPDRRFDVDVQLIPTAGDEVAFRGQLAGDEPHTGTSDARGRLSFESVAAGTYELRLDCGDDVIVAAFDLEVSP
jgi:hypothetical protein